MYFVNHPFRNTKYPVTTKKVTTKATPRKTYTPIVLFSVVSVVSVDLSVVDGGVEVLVIFVVGAVVIVVEDVVLSVVLSEDEVVFVA